MKYISAFNDTILILQQVSHADEGTCYFHLSFNEVITIFLSVAGIGIAIYQFIRQMKKNRDEQILANRKNWYLTVIVVPQLESINQFYHSLIDKLISDIQSLNNSNPNGLVELSQMQADGKDEINAFFDHLQSLVKSYDIDLSQRLSEIVLDLEDCVTIILSDCYFNINSFSPTEIRRKLLLNKKNIIALLYTGIVNR